MKGIALLDAGVKERFHLLARYFPRCFRAETHEFMANGFEQKTRFRALDHERVNIEELDVREQAARVFLAQFRIGVFVGVSMATNEAGVEEASTACGVGDGKRNTAQGSEAILHGCVLGFVVNFTVLGGFWEVELFNVLAETRRKVAHQEVGLLHGFLGVDQAFLHLRGKNRIGEARWRGVGPSR